MISRLAQASSALLASPPCAHVQRFPGGHSLHLAFGSFFYPHPSPFILPLINHCDRCLVPLAQGLKDGGHEFASHEGVHCNSVYGLAVPQVEAPGHPRHPPPLATQLWEIKFPGFDDSLATRFSSCDKSRVVRDAIPIIQEMRHDR